MNDTSLPSGPPDPSPPPARVFHTEAPELPDDVVSPSGDTEPVLLLIDAAGDLQWAADAAVAVAASLARAGRRIVLADLSLEEPVLHERLEEANADGIVDIFLYGASVSRSARPARGRGFFFIPVGTYAADPEEVYAHPRWEKLVAGFRDAGATLVALVPASARGWEHLARWGGGAVLLGEAGDEVRARLAGLAVRSVLVPQWVAPALPEPGSLLPGPPEELPSLAPPAEPELLPPFPDTGAGDAEPDGPDPAEPEVAGAEAAYRDAAPDPTESSPSAPEIGGEGDRFLADEPFAGDAPEREPAMGGTGAADEPSAPWPPQAPERTEPDPSPRDDLPLLGDFSLPPPRPSSDLPAWMMEPGPAPAAEPPPPSQGSGGDGEREAAAADDDVPFWERPVPGEERDRFEHEPLVIRVQPGDGAAGERHPADVPVSVRTPDREVAPELPPRSVVGARRSRRSGPGLLVWVLALAVVIAIAVAVAVYLRPDLFGGTPGAGALTTPADTAETSGVVPPPPAAPVAQGEELPWVVQVQAFNNFDAARAQVDRQGRRVPEVPVYLVPEITGGVLYYKVMAGAVPDTAGARALRARLVEAGVVSATEARDEEGRWSLIQARPLAFRLGEFSSREEAQAQADSLAARRIPAYPLGIPYSDGTERWRIYAGAFPDSVQAEPLRQILREAEFPARLVTRVGQAPTLAP
jgi:hypothetical protein